MFWEGRASSRLRHLGSTGSACCDLLFVYVDEVARLLEDPRLVESSQGVYSQLEYQCGGEAAPQIIIKRSVRVWCKVCPF